MASGQHDAALGADDDIGRALIGRPTNILVIGDFGGEYVDSAIEDRAPRRAVDVDALLGEIAPRVRVRVDDLSSTDDSLVDTALTFRRLSDFSPAAIEAAVPTITRARGGSHGSVAERSGTDLERAIAAALRGAAAPPPGDGDGQARAEAQLALVRGVARLVSLERSWLGLSRVLDAAQTARHACEVSTLDLSARELSRELAQIDAGGESALATILDALSADAETRPDLIVVDHPLGFSPDGVAALRGLARLSMESAALALASLDPAAIVAEPTSGPAAASALARLLDEPTYAGFRALRREPSAAVLAVVASMVERPHEHAPSAKWFQSGASALCESLVASGETSLRFGRTGVRCPIPATAVASGPSGPSSSEVSDTLAARGLIGFVRDVSGAIHVGPSAPVVLDPPRMVGGPDEASRAAGLDVRTRLALSRLVRLASIATRKTGAPGRDAGSLGAFGSLLASTLSPEAGTLVGEGAAVTVCAGFDGVDERSLRLEIALAARGGGVGALAPTKSQELPVAFEVRCGCYPLA